jgi:hypothetical protein
MRSDLNVATSSLPNENDAQPRSTAVFPLHLPRLSQDLLASRSCRQIDRRRPIASFLVGFSRGYSAAGRSRTTV